MAEHGVVLHGLAATADLERAFFRLVQESAGEGRLMRALIHAELLKLRTRTTAGLLLATLALVALTVAASIPKVGATNAPRAVERPRSPGQRRRWQLRRTRGVDGAARQARLHPGVPLRHGDVDVPGRASAPAILVAKWLSLALVSVVVTIATLAVAVPFAS